MWIDIKSSQAMLSLVDSSGYEQNVSGSEPSVFASCLPRSHWRVREMRNYSEADAMQRGRTIINIHECRCFHSQPSLLPVCRATIHAFLLISTHRLTAAGSRSALRREALRRGGACTDAQVGTRFDDFCMATARRLHPSRSNQACPRSCLTLAVAGMALLDMGALRQCFRRHWRLTQ